MYYIFIKFITLEKVLQSLDSVAVLRLTKVIYTCDMTLVHVIKNTKVSIPVASYEDKETIIHWYKMMALIGCIS